MAALLGLALVSCDKNQVTEPPLDGAVWTRLTPTNLDLCLYPDERLDSLVYSADVRVPVGRDLNGNIVYDFRQRIAVSGVDGANPYIAGYPGPASWTDTRPRWVGSQGIAFQSNRNGDYDIWYRDIETGNDRLIVGSPMNESWPSPRPGSPGLVYVEYDNNTSTEGSADLRGRLVLVPDTAAVPLEKIYLTADTLRCGEPDWNPTGNKLAFSVENASDLTRHLFTMDFVPGDSLPVQITFGYGRDFNPRWSPDGQRIVFNSDRLGRWGVWVVHPQGESKGLKLVSFDDTGASVFTPAWTPDGTGIVASSDGRGNVRSLWLLSNLPAFGF